jgi:hypothetical protein
VQYGTAAQYSTVQYSTVQFGTAVQERRGGEGRGEGAKFRVNEIYNS